MAPTKPYLKCALDASLEFSFSHVGNEGYYKAKYNVHWSRWLKWTKNVTNKVPSHCTS